MRFDVHTCSTTYGRFSRKKRLIAGIGVWLMAWAFSLMPVVHAADLPVLDSKDGAAPEASGLILRVRHQAIRGHLEHWNCVTITFNRENDWFARLDYARRIGTPSVMSNDAWSRDRLWFILGKNF